MVNSTDYLKNTCEILKPNYNLNFIPQQYSFSVYETSIMAKEVI